MAWEQKLSIARLAAAQKMPYFRTALWALIPVASSDVATMAVNARAVMKVNPKFVEANTIERLAAALLHEVSHVLRDHGPRFCTVENLPLSVLHGGVTREIKAKSELWNLAGDACINEDLLLAGCDCGKDWVYAGNLKQPKGLTTEAYYEALKMQAKSPPSGQTAPAPGGGDGGAGDGGDGDGEEGSPADAIGKGRCGSGAGQHVQGEADFEDASGRSDAELASMRRATADEIQRFAESDKSRGTVPANWKRWADVELTPSKVRWQDKLAAYTRQAMAFQSGRQDYTFNRPARRQNWSRGSAIQPAMFAPKVNVAFVVDTSGSMTDKELAEALVEAVAVVQAIGTKLTFVSCDASVHDVVETSDLKTMLESLKGGGGTDFRPAFKALERKQRARPNVVIYATDGFGTAPKTAPDWCRTIWLMIGQHRARPAPWGEVVATDGL